MRYRRLITIAAVVAACSALGAAPALASQPSAVHPAPVAAAHPGHAVAAPHTAGGPGCNVQNCILEDAGNLVVVQQFTTPVLGRVSPAHCWPFSDCTFDTRYSGDEVLQFIAHTPPVAGDCLQTDSVHSGVGYDPCGSHNAGTYWVTVGNGGSRGTCNPHPVFWMVNVGITNHYDDSYPWVMFFNGNGLYAHPRLPVSDDDQWCVIPG
jgi:hypothetical protein